MGPRNAEKNNRFPHFFVGGNLFLSVVHFSLLAGARKKLFFVGDSTPKNLGNATPFYRFRRGKDFFRWSGQKTRGKDCCFVVANLFLFRCSFFVVGRAQGKKIFSLGRIFSFLLVSFRQEKKIRRSVLRQGKKKKINMKQTVH